jgi:luciferase family oxidoreductase group 1
LTDFSVLDLCPVPEGATPPEALRRSVDLARHAEALGYRRFWLAEHHNMVGIASAATAVVIGLVAGATRSIRVGAGGIMLTNHAPLVVAEQFGTLESLYPGRIDLGLGRAPGATDRTALALRRRPEAVSTFPQDVLELQALLGPLQPGQQVQAVPGTNTNVPLWMLGSSLYGAEVAAAFGLPYAFAAQFAPAALMPALQVYREKFQPSQQLRRPYAMVGVNVVAADSDAEARRLFTSVQQAFLNMKRGRPGRLPPPVDDIDSLWNQAEKADVANTLSCSFVGTPATITEELRRFIAATGADELIVATSLHDHAARLHSYELLAAVTKTLT